MSIVALKPGYSGSSRDRVGNFHGNQLLYIGWDRHLMYSAPMAIPVPPALPFGALTKDVIPSLYPAHPDTAKIDWNTVQWMRGNKPFKPDPSKTLAENGLGHKALLRFRTPGLDGLNGSCN